MTPFGACILSSDGPRLTADEKALFRAVRPFGFILFARHIESPDQVRALCDEMRAAAGHAALITVDQEGGRVQRFRAPLWREWRPALEHAQEAQDGARAMYLRSRLIAQELHDLGLDSNCVPNLDIAVPQTHPFLRNRCYGTTPEEVIRHGRAVAQGALDGGVVPILKHIPGHGRSAVDTHFDMPRVGSDAQTLQREDFKPFTALADLPMAMTGHLVFDAFDSTRPATLSPVMVEVIRSQIGFDGLLMTDDISMQALSGTLAERARGAIAAGVDVVLHCNDTFADRVAVADAAGPMTPQAMARAQTALAARRAPRPVDIPAAEADLADLLHGQVYV